MQYLLNQYAERLKVHPRTIIRALAGKENVYWAEGFDYEIGVEDVATAFSCEVKLLQKVMQGKDEFFSQKELCQPGLADISPRLFRYRKYKPSLHLGRIKRFSRVEFLNQHLVKRSPRFGGHYLGPDREDD